MSIRPVKTTGEIEVRPAKGGRVHLRRAFGFGNTSDFDPFLLLDDFRNDVPETIWRDFHGNPHRGIETITYCLREPVEHKDSLAITARLLRAMCNG